MPEVNAEIIVYGTLWCWDCRRARKILDANQIKYRFIDIERNIEGRSFVEKVNRGMRSVPTIVFPDGTLLVEPGDSELADCLGVALTNN